MFKLKYNYVTNTSDEPYIQYWFAKKLEAIAGSTVTGEGSDFNIVSPTERSLKDVVLKGDTTQETLSGKNLFGVGEISTKFCSATLTNGVLTVTPTGTGNPRINISLLTQLPAGNYVLNSETYLSKTTQIKNASEITLVGLSNNYKNVTFTLAETGAILSFNFLNAENTDPITIDLNTLQIESGSTATSYEPYCGGISSPNPDYPQTVNTVTGDQTITITKGSDVQTYSLTLGDLELCKIGDYQDYIYKDGEKWYVKKNTNNVTIDGTESWTKLNNAFQTSVSVTTGKASEVAVAYSNYYTYYSGQSAITSNIPNGQFGWNTSGVLTIRNDSCADAPAFKTWLGNNNTSILYPLATPTDTEITDETLLGQLNNLLSDGYLSAGTNTVQTSATGLPIIINIKA